MKLSVRTYCACAALLISANQNGVVDAFTARLEKRSFSATRLQQSSAPIPYSADRVKSVGAGVPVIPAGDFLLFDPAEEGMLGGTKSLQHRLEQGSQFQPAYLPASTGDTVAAASSSGTSSPATTDAQAWLEDIGVPQNFAKPTAPVTATVLGRAKLIADDAPGDIQHVVLKLPEGFHYVEGQSISVIPPGVDSVKGKPYKPRLYSIASTRYGDILDGNTVSLCVRRAEYFDPATGKIDSDKAGVCSNFLCDTTPGTTVKVAGPIGKTMLLPGDPTKDIIMVATGTGIAPFRAFLHRLFMEETPARHMYQGKAWLVLGVPVTGGLLYPQELDIMQRNAQSSASGAELEVTYAISREMKNAQGGKLYVQDVLKQEADKLFDRLEGGAQIYFCGLKGMMPGIVEALEQVATSRGIDWPSKLKELQSNHQWHVEVY